MLSKNEVKDIQSLYRKKQREESWLFVAEGSKLAEELLKSDYVIKQIYATESWLSKNTLSRLLVKEISQDELARISNLQTAHDVLMVVEQKLSEQPIDLTGRLTLLLDGIQDPGNMGTIIRIADWFGVTDIICSNDCVDLYNPKVVQSTMGSFTRVNVMYNDLVPLLDSSSVPVYGALLDGKNVYETGRVGEGVLVIGSEGKGIRDALLTKITHPVTIPRMGGAESLNAAVATGIILGCMKNGR